MESVGWLPWWLVGLAGLALASWMVGRAAAALIWRPLVLTRSFARKGVRGPPYRLFWGSIREIRALNASAMAEVLDPHSHDIPRRVFPHYHRWSLQYGGTFLYWIGTQPTVFLSDPEMAKQVLTKFSFFPKDNPRASVVALLGKGLVLAEGVDWVRHRRVVSPAFAMDRLKALTATMAGCTAEMLDGWGAQVASKEDRCKEIEVDAQFLELTATIIGLAAFGIGGDDGKKVFQAQAALLELAFASTFDLSLPGARYLPTRANLRRWRMDRRMRRLLRSIIQRRLDGGAASYGDDLLGMMMDACRGEAGTGGSAAKGKAALSLTIDEIMDECKTFFFAGHETTAHLLSWTMFLLSSNPDWQEKLRQEVFMECGAAPPDSDSLARLKLTGMVLLEASRLYSPVTVMFRRAAQEVDMGGLTIPQGTSVTIPALMMHRSEAVWGADAGDFNPLRFQNGISRAAAHPNALIAFSAGPRNCVGQGFAMLEAKLVLAMILQRFSFSLSAAYRHAPVKFITLRPQFGLPLLLRSAAPPRSM